MDVSIRTLCFFFFFNDTATTEIYTLSLHDALPICRKSKPWPKPFCSSRAEPRVCMRSEEHTSELQSHDNLVCRLLLEKKAERVGAPPHCTVEPRPRPPSISEVHSRVAFVTVQRRPSRAARPAPVGVLFLFVFEEATTEIYSLSPLDGLRLI